MLKWKRDYPFLKRKINRQIIFKLLILNIKLKNNFIKKNLKKINFKKKCSLETKQCIIQI